MRRLARPDYARTGEHRACRQCRRFTHDVVSLRIYIVGGGFTTRARYANHCSLLRLQLINKHMDRCHSAGKP
jgi:hypothetical protein